MLSIIFRALSIFKCLFFKISMVILSVILLSVLVHHLLVLLHLAFSPLVFCAFEMPILCWCASLTELTWMLTLPGLAVFKCSEKCIKAHELCFYFARHYGTKWVLSVEVRFVVGTAARRCESDSWHFKCLLNKSYAFCTSRHAHLVYKMFT